LDTQLINGINREICATIRCDISKRIWNAVKKWAEDKQNEGVLKQVNN
jgi:hypothetical protein